MNRLKSIQSDREYLLNNFYSTVRKKILKTYAD